MFGGESLEEKNSKNRRRGKVSVRLEECSR
jgi:hypothetical protein